ncbi:MAG: membrane protein insertion efficiency factor YidD [Culicoidibacterales bacterium]
MKNWLIKSIRWYQRAISSQTPPNCRFYPTCSQYTIEAIELHGSFKGGMLGLWRILRCNPFNKHFGLDPVPQKSSCTHKHHK